MKVPRMKAYIKASEDDMWACWIYLQPSATELIAFALSVSLHTANLPLQHPAEALEQNTIMSS